MLGLADGKHADVLVGILIDRVNGLSALMRGSLTWDLGTGMTRHAHVTEATGLPLSFAHPRSL